MVPKNAVTDFHKISRSLLSVLLIMFLISSCKQGQVRQTVVVSENQGQKVAPQFTSDIPGIIRSNLRSQYQQLPSSLLKASFYQIEISIAENYQSLVARESVQYVNNENVNLNEIYLQFFPNAFGPFLIINSSKVNGVEVKPEMQWNNTAAKFKLSSPLRPDEEVLLQLEYELKISTDSSFSYGLFVFANGILSLYQFIPLIPVYDQNGWQVHQPDPKGDLTFNDAAFFQVEVDAPQALILAASGTRVSQSVNDGRRTEIYQAGPVRDFYLAGSEDFQATSRKWQDVVITSYAPAKMKSSSDKVLDYAENALSIFTKDFGPYPYNELDLICATMQGAYGMEYSGIVSISIDLYNPSGGADAATYLQFATVHEIAHQWFFNLVGSNQVMEPWLDEGMAQYATKLYYLERYGVQAADAIKETWLQRWQRIQSQPFPIGEPVSAFINDVQYSAIIYGRAPLFIEAIREKIGDQVFKKFLLDYSQKYLWKNANTDDFRSTAENNCQCSLELQFKDWVYLK